MSAPKMPRAARRQPLSFPTTTPLTENEPAFQACYYFDDDDDAPTGVRVTMPREVALDLLEELALCGAHTDGRELAAALYLELREVVRGPRVGARVEELAARGKVAAPDVAPTPRVDRCAGQCAQGAACALPSHRGPCQCWRTRCRCHG